MKAAKGLPSELLVGPHRYKLTADPRRIAMASHADGSTLAGQTDKVRLRIAVDPNQARSQLADTVLHESFHALFALVGADFDLGEDVEERLIRRLAPAFLEFMCRNPALIAWLTEE